MGIDWYIDNDGEGRPNLERSGRAKPIFLLTPGLGGGNNNLYTHAIAEVAQRRGYKVGIILFRCAAGLPITSCKLSCSYSWRDCKAAIDFVHSKYVLDQVTRKPRCRFYGYGTSLGA
jgi:predicted alpha/beta-fold hydrolase